MHARPTSSEHGIVLIAVLLTFAFLTGLGVALGLAVNSETQQRAGYQRSTTGFYAAEAGVNRGMARFRNIFLAYQIPQGADFDPYSAMVGARQVSYQLREIPPNPSVVTVPAGRPFGGLSAIEYRYAVTSEALSPKGDLEARLGSEFEVDYIPLFQFLAFYEGDLEILPGPTMTLHGPIHTNGDLYLNANNTLTIEDLPPTQPTVHVSASGDLYRGRKDRSECRGTVVIDALMDADHNGNLDPLTLACAGSGPIPSSTIANWQGSIQVGVQAIGVPTPDVIAKGEGTYWQQADLRIVLRLNEQGQLPGGPPLPHRIVVEDVAGGVDSTLTGYLEQFMLDNPNALFYTDVPLPGRDRNKACTEPDSYRNPDSYNPPFASCSRVHTQTITDRDYRRGGFYNNREHRWMYLLNLDVEELLAWNMAQPASGRLFPPDDASDGGLVLFLSVSGPASGTVSNYGARVFDSPDLPFPGGLSDPTGLTVVTDQAAYIQGDYNAISKQPAAVLGDAINVLSSNWSGSGCRNDCQSRKPLTHSKRVAGDTTIFAAILGGADVTTSGNYNGGLENFPRFHENWSGKTLTYRGSFVSLGTPLHSNGPWCGTGSTCNIYNPPRRNWDYDIDFNTVENLPPLTPRFVLVQQILFTQEFR